MGGTAMIVSQKSMLEAAHNVLKEFPRAVDRVYYQEPTGSVTELVEKLVVEGVDIVIARGVQAMRIKESFDIQVIEIQMTGQEIAVLVHKMKRLCAARCPAAASLPGYRPKIALLGQENMFPDLSAFNELFDIDLMVRYHDINKELGYLAREVISQGADGVIGGTVDVEYCMSQGLPAMLNTSTEESIRDAVKMSLHFREIIEQRKRQEEKSEALFHGAFGGFIFFSEEGIAQRCNQTAVRLLELSESRIINSHITDIFPKLDMDRFNEAIQSGNSISDFVNIRKRSYAVIIRPLTTGGKKDGAVVSFRKTAKDLSGWNSAQLPNRTSFAITTASPALKRCYQTAQYLSQTDRHIMIIGEAGTDTIRLARSIHANNSNTKNGPFICADCACWSYADQQAEYLFGYSSKSRGESAAGMIGLARGGVLFLDRIESLANNVQQRLWQVLCNKRFVYLDAAPVYIDFRLIARSTMTLGELLKSRKMLPELYHMLAPMSLTVPPLRETPEDLPRMIEEFFSRFCSDYSRFLNLTPEAMNQLCSYNWEGNTNQLYLFLERLVVSTNEQNISRAAIKGLMRDLYDVYEPGTVELQTPERPSGYTPEEMRVIMALRKHHGDRESTAQELGISKTTLWRWMKKYDITTKY